MIEHPQHAPTVAQHPRGSGDFLRRFPLRPQRGEQTRCLQVVALAAHHVLEDQPNLLVAQRLPVGQPGQGFNEPLWRVLIHFGSRPAEGVGKAKQLNLSIQEAYPSTKKFCSSLVYGCLIY